MAKAAVAKDRTTAAVRVILRLALISAFLAFSKIRMIERDDLGKQSNKCYESTLDCHFLKILKKTKEYDMPAIIWTALAILACLSLPAFAQVQQKPVNGLLAGTFHTERPTLLSLGFSWCPSSKHLGQSRA